MSERKKTVILALCLLLIIEAGFCVWEYIIRPKANLCDNPYGITIHCKDEDLLQECLSEMDKLPPSLLERFKQEKWALFVGDGYLKDVRMQFNNGKIMGMTRTACKEILVSSPEEIAHEFGHFLYITLDAPNACMKRMPPLPICPLISRQTPPSILPKALLTTLTALMYSTESKRRRHILRIYSEMAGYWYECSHYLSEKRSARK